MATKKDLARLVDQCAIWSENDEEVGDLGRTFPSYTEIIAKLLRRNVNPEKITTEVIKGVSIDHYTGDSITSCIQRYALA